MVNLFYVLIFYLIATIHSQPEPAPAPNPGSEPPPKPSPEPSPNPEPTPSPVTPPATPVMPPSTPVMPPSAPVMPPVAPAPVLVKDYYFLQVPVNNNFNTSYEGVIALTGNNDTLTLFGLRNSADIQQIPPVNESIQYTVGGETWKYFMRWDPDRFIVCYSQPPPDGMKVYWTYYLWVNSTEVSENTTMITKYTLSYFNGTGHVDLTSNFTFNNLTGTHPLGMKIAATREGPIFIYGTGMETIWQVVDGIVTMIVNMTGPVPRYAPAMVGWNGGFYMQGGELENRTKLSDLWYFNGTGWQMSSGYVHGLNTSYHSAAITILPSPSGPGFNVTLYFYNFFPPLSMVNASLVTWDGTTTYYHALYEYPYRTASMATVIGNQLYFYGGLTVEIPSMNSTIKTYTDTYQFIDEYYCTSIKDCETCLGIYECGWCLNGAAPGAPACVAGFDSSPPLVNTTCNANQNLLSGVEYCPEMFPSWAIALIVIGGVILVGGIVFGIMKLRSGGKSGYDPV